MEWTDVFHPVRRLRVISWEEKYAVWAGDIYVNMDFVQKYVSYNMFASRSHFFLEKWNHFLVVGLLFLTIQEVYIIGFLLHLSWPMFVSEKHSHCKKLCPRQPVCPAWIPLVLQLLRLVPLHFPVDFSPQTTEVWWRTMSKTEKHQRNRTLRSSKGKLMSAYEICRNFSTSNQILKSSIPS